MSLDSKIAAWNDQRKKDLILSYNEKGFRASGKWSRELMPMQNVTTFGIRVLMFGSNYTYYMINGRKPGKFPPINAIEQWIKDKNIKPSGDITEKQLAFLIARKIAVKGIRPTAKRRRLITDVYNDKNLQELIDIVKDEVFFELRIKTIKELK
jgi:hypothetical protein